MTFESRVESKYRNNDPGNPRKLSLIFGMSYLVFTYMLYWISPYNWPRFHYIILLYIPLIFLCLATGHLSALKRHPVHGSKISVRWTILIGSISAIVLLIPSSRIYAGRWPWELAAALANQKEAYSNLQDQLIFTEGTRGPIVIARAILSPFTFAVLPIGIIYWNKIGKFLKLLVVAAAMAGISFSILRGTTRELADILVIGSSAILVRIARTPKRIMFFLQYWKLLVVGIIALLIVFSALVGRTQMRMGGISVHCFNEAAICADIYSPPYNYMSDSLVYGITVITGYLSQGYYGTTLATELPFESTYGLGHSPLVISIYTFLTGDDSLSYRSYTSRLRTLGWSDEYQWSSLITWLANDISFWGVPFLMIGLGILWGRAWVDATVARDDTAAILFCIIMMMIFYLPANNQLMSTLENYTLLVFWSIRYWFTRRVGAPISR